MHKLFSLVMFSLLSLSIHSNPECLLTEEYKKELNSVYERVYYANEAFERCESSLSEAYYWKAVAKCTKKKLGVNIGGGCQHLVSQGSFPIEEYETAHCKILKHTDEAIAQYKKELITNIKVEKCKK